MTRYFMNRDSGCDTNSMNERTEWQQRYKLTQPTEVVYRNGSFQEASSIRLDRDKGNCRKIIKYVLFAVFAAMAFCAFVMSISNQRAVVTLSEPVVSAHSATEFDYQESIQKLNATIHHLVHTLYKDSDGHHDRINSTMHEHKSDLLEEIESLWSENERLNQELHEEKTNRSRLEAIVTNQNKTLMSVNSKLQQLTARVANDAYAQAQLKQKVENVESSVQALRDADSVSQNVHAQSVQTHETLDRKIQNHHRPSSGAQKAQGSLMMLPLCLLIAASAVRNAL